MTPIKVIAVRFGLAVRVADKNLEENFISIKDKYQGHYELFLLGDSLYVFNRKTKKVFIIAISNIREMEVDPNSIPVANLRAFTKLKKELLGEGQRDT